MTFTLTANQAYADASVTDRAYQSAWRARRPKTWLGSYRLEADQAESTRRERGSAPIATNAPIDYALSQLAALEAAVPMDAKVSVRLMACLRASLTEESVFPTVVSDGEAGAVAEWRAGARLLALEINADGEYSLVAADERGRRSVNDVGWDKPDLDAFAALVRNFTRYVGERNPGWRNQYV